MIGIEGLDFHEGWEEIAFNEEVEPADGLESLYGMWYDTITYLMVK